jgi:hypothetical protein
MKNKMDRPNRSNYQKNPNNPSSREVIRHIKMRALQQAASLARIVPHATWETPSRSKNNQTEVASRNSRLVYTSSMPQSSKKAAVSSSVLTPIWLLSSSTREMCTVQLVSRAKQARILLVRTVVARISSVFSRPIFGLRALKSFLKAAYRVHKIMQEVQHSRAHLKLRKKTNKHRV